MTPTMLDALLSSTDPSRAVAAVMRGRDAPFSAFLTRCAPDLGVAARGIEERVHRKGQVYSFGRGIYALDAADLPPLFRPAMLACPATSSCR